MHTEQQNHGEPGGHPGEGPRSASTGSATAEFTYTNPVESFVGTVRDLVTRPVAFFRDMARRGDFVNPVIFALVCAVISAVIGGFLGVQYATVGIGDTGVGGAIGALVASMFFTPIISVIACLYVPAFCTCWSPWLSSPLIPVSRPRSGWFLTRTLCSSWAGSRYWDRWWPP